ncbi:inactive protein RESTRICTED TEV MOVEMENT 2-like [Triticum dicoccoides]|uniref:inactive protein RESTRICTED TEV MOVEMENT 2-like n=1 Tax=Triticum dicoccoides TaxID=85692 RepID=UPI0018901F0F|nr:inactive protein RESTRICTED TEV MOVEMENT 2-like [Triticum dicoccoides]
MAAARTYVDFVPSHDLVEDRGKHTLVVNLPGFKKEHLRVQIDNYGRLRVSGERQLEGGQWSRFRKEFQVPEGCDAGGIRARFEKDGVLNVTMPRLTPLEDDPKAAADAAADAEAARLAAADAEEKKRLDEMEEDARKRHAGDEEEHASGEGEDAHHQAVQAASAGRQAYGFARDRSRSGMVRALLLAVAVALVGAAGLYARYRWMDPSAESETAPADGAIVSLFDY